MLQDKSIPLARRVFLVFTIPASAGGLTAPEVARFLNVSYSPQLTQILLNLTVENKLSLDVVKSSRGLAVLYRPTENMPLDAQMTLGGFEGV